MRRLAAIAVVLLAGCALNPPGAPIQTHGITLENGCVVDAIKCCQELAGSGAEPQILLVRYTVNGQAYGHAMTRYFWPPQGRPYSRAYVYDRQNASLILPTSINADSAAACGRYMISSTTDAWWSDPTGLQP